MEERIYLFCRDRKFCVVCSKVFLLCAVTWKAENVPNKWGNLSREISKQSKVPSGFFVLIIVKCKKGDRLKEELLNKKKLGLYFEIFQMHR